MEEELTQEQSAFGDTVNSLTLKDWRVVRNHTGYGMKQVLSDADVLMNEDVLAAVYMIIKQRTQPDFTYDQASDLTGEAVIAELSNPKAA